MPRTAENPPTPFALAVVEAIRERMDSQRRNQAAVAELSGIGANYLSERMRGVKSFTLSDIEKLGQALGFNPSEFLCGIETPAVSNVTPLRPTDVGGTAEDQSETEEPIAAGSDRTTAEPDD